jgi:hypothetical protein
VVVVLVVVAVVLVSVVVGGGGGVRIAVVKKECKYIKRKYSFITIW